MPEGHRRLARFPAQVNWIALAGGREVDQSEIDVLHQAAERFDAMDQSMDFEFELAETWRREG